MRVDSDPVGRMIEQFLATAYVAHPDGRSGVGCQSEISQVSATEAEAFHAKYYVPSNIVIAIAGDVKPTDEAMLERYFGAIPAGPKPEEMTTIEPPQRPKKTVTIRENNQPSSTTSRATDDNSTTPSTTLIYRYLQRCCTPRGPLQSQAEDIAVDKRGFTGWPGNKYPGFSPLRVPRPLRLARSGEGATRYRDEEEIRPALEPSGDAPMKEARCNRGRLRLRADLLRGLDDNPGHCCPPGRVPDLPRRLWVSALLRTRRRRQSLAVTSVASPIPFSN